MSQRMRPAGKKSAAVEAVDEEQRAVAPKPEERKRTAAPGSGKTVPSVESSRDGCVKV